MCTIITYKEQNFTLEINMLKTICNIINQEGSSPNNYKKNNNNNNKEQYQISINRFAFDNKKTNPEKKIKNQIPELEKVGVNLNLLWS